MISIAFRLKVYLIKIIIWMIINLGIKSDWREKTTRQNGIRGEKPINNTSKHFKWTNLCYCWLGQNIKYYIVISIFNIKSHFSKKHLDEQIQKRLQSLLSKQEENFIRRIFHVQVFSSINISNTIKQTQFCSWNLSYAWS